LSESTVKVNGEPYGSYADKLLNQYYDSIFDLVDDMREVGIKQKEITRLLIRDLEYAVKLVTEGE
jgi:hypothetical protein